MAEISTLGVIGAGQMGNGIADVSCKSSTVLGDD
jgi:3-hydroxyacyl-CoA dehydrogenase